MAHPGGDPADELVEWIDEDGQVIDIVRRAEMRARHLRHRAVYLAVIGSDDRLLIHQRAPDKDVWPSRWDVAAGGVLAVGEAWEVAARRELAEELGVDDAIFEPLGTGRFDDDQVHVAGHVYRVRSDGPFLFNDGEVVDARFVTAAELAELQASADFCPDSLAIVLPLIGW